MEQPQEKQNSNRKFYIIGCSIITICVVLVGALIVGGVWLLSGDEGGVRLPNQMAQYALDYLEKNDILEPDEELLAYYDVTVMLNGTEAAILTTKRVIYHRGGQSTAIFLKDVEDIQHRYESMIGDIIEITSTSGVTMKIQIAPLNQGETFYNVLLNAWERARE